MCTYTFLNILLYWHGEEAYGSVCIYGVWPPKVCMCMCVCVCVIYLYNIILYTIYMATVLAVWRKNVICSCLLFDGGLSSFPFGGCIIIIIIIKKLFFFSSFLSSWTRGSQYWGRGCNPEPADLTRVLVYRFPFTIYVRAHCLPGP